MSVLTVRSYNVRFGDAILVSVPDRNPRGGEEIRHILIDVGNVLGGEGGKDDVFEPIVRDIRRRTKGRPIDLYVMTHEHLDHVQGLPFASARGVELPIEYAWLSASAGPGYYVRHPEAEKKRALLQEAYFAIDRHLAANPAAATSWMAALMANNHPARTQSCVDFLRNVAHKHTRYVHREVRAKVGTHHPFQEASLQILAPEKDTSSYYGWMRPMAIGGSGADAIADAVSPPPAEIEPPDGVDPDAFRRLLEGWGAGISGNVLAIDRATNNTSVVILLEWRGWKLMFAGDAEHKSWRMMHQKGLLKPVHFLKVGHHGSHNATPPDPILEAILPKEKPDRKKRVSLVSTCVGSYRNVPHGETLARLESRCDEILRTDSVAPGKSVRVRFRG